MTTYLLYLGFCLLFAAIVVSTVLMASGILEYVPQQVTMGRVAK